MPRRDDNTFDGVLTRTIQLDALAYAMIVVLMVFAIVLAFMLFGRIAPPDGWLLNDPWVQLAGLALIGGFVIYLLDQHARLRSALMSSHDELEESKAATERAFKGLVTAHNAAEIMVSVADEGSLEKVVASIRAEIGAGAVAIVGEEIVLSAADDGDTDRVMNSVTAVAADAVRRAAPMAVKDAEDGSETIAIPLRLLGRLHGVLCVWRSVPPFSTDELEGLQLVARVIELGWESRLLFNDVNERLEGTMTIVTSLIDQRIPGYRERTDVVRRLALKVGEQVGMTPHQLDDLRVAVDLRDFGVLRGEVETERIGIDPTASELSHPLHGAHLASLGKFPASVQRAILCHHESPDGSGYPVHLTAEQIPLEAKVIKACDAFVELAPRGDDEPAAMSALQTLRTEMRSSFDPKVVAALTRTVVEERPSRRPAEKIDAA